MYRQFKQKGIASFLCALLIILQLTSVALAKEENKDSGKENTPKLALKIDRKDLDQLPGNFRMSTDEFKNYPKNGVMPSRKGLDKLGNSASSCFSEQEFVNVLKQIPVSPSKVYVIDLRGESHGYLNGTCVSWFASPSNWGNDGRSLSMVKGIEREQLQKAFQASPVKIYNFDDGKNILLDAAEMSVERVRTEEEMVKEHGANYFRLALSDHFRPEDADVDAFLNFYKKLPKDAWLHYHCFAGMGRTTIFAVMADILKNAQTVSFKDIVDRQGILGNTNLSDIPDSKKNWGRKAYIERYQFVQHFYDYVKNSPRDLSKSWSQWTKEHGYETYVPDYEGYVWRIDTENAAKLPRNYRDSQGGFKVPQKVNPEVDLSYVPSSEGLDTLNISGSAQYSELEFSELLSKLKTIAKGPIYMVDLRQESHGLLNGNGVSWYGDRDWSNINRNYDQVLLDENMRIKAARNKNTVLSALNDEKKAVTPRIEKITSALTEEEMVKQAGVNYFRITATDHIWPSPENIDRFIAFVRTLPSNAWLHFHCQAGEGRTTAYMVMYDMMRNPEVSAKDVVYRQYLMGGQYAMFSGSGKNNWKNDYYTEKTRMIPQFYQYVQENAANGFQRSWSQWLKAKDEIPVQRSIQ
ncbi:MAG: hypothetical protein ACRC7I_06005 [Selenomonadaceae bacterium]